MTAVPFWLQPTALLTKPVGQGALGVPLIPSLQSQAARLPDVLWAPKTTASGPRRHMLSLRAGMAELVLLNRLQARTRPELTQGTLERAARIIEVTSRSWLGD